MKATEREKEKVQIKWEVGNVCVCVCVRERERGCVSRLILFFSPKFYLRFTISPFSLFAIIGSRFTFFVSDEVFKQGADPINNFSALN